MTTGISRRSNITAKHQRRNALGRCTQNPTEIEVRTTGTTEAETVESQQPGASTPIPETHDLFVPNLFVNSTEESEIDNSIEIDQEEGTISLDIRTEEIINEPANTESEEITEKVTEQSQTETDADLITTSQ